MRTFLRINVVKTQLRNIKHYHAACQLYFNQFMKQAKITKIHLRRPVRNKSLNSLMY